MKHITQHNEETMQFWPKGMEKTLRSYIDNDEQVLIEVHNLDKAAQAAANWDLGRIFVEDKITTSDPNEAVEFCDQWLGLVGFCVHILNP